MSKKMFIDATHPEETRVVVVDGQRVDEFDFESQSRRQLRGNIYLATVTRVEPSLQAAFVEYGGNRHGFLAFNEIHPDYYKIPSDDRKKLLEEERKAAADAAEREERALESGQPVEDGGDDGGERRRPSPFRNYKIQEVIKRRQVLLVQVVKEERGNKGAALTTYLSLAGRYCVLMPNTARGGGISRKITSATDRKRLKKVAAELEVPDGMGLIIRTAGAKRTKAEIKRDSDYLMRLWETIRTQTIGDPDAGVKPAVAPCLIYEESNLVKRAIRDLYDKDIDGVQVDGEAAYREAKDFIRMLMPSHAKKVQPYREPAPLFLKHKIEDQLEQIYQPIVQLKSGGYLVINQTEALVAIDVNSGRATRERNIEATALKTNLEAAEEACRQFRLRDLAGLIVVDFIDMEEAKNVRAVEKKMRDCLKRDRARVQASKISSFGLMELSRQRRRASLLEGSHTECPTCKGRGIVRSVESAALHVLRRIEEEGVKGRAKLIRVRTTPSVALYILNEKRESLNTLEQRCGMRALIDADEAMIPPELEITRLEERPEDEVFEAAPRAEALAPEGAPPEAEDEDVAEEDAEAEAAEADVDLDEDAEESAEAEAGERDSGREAAAEGEGGRGRRRRRRRRRKGGPEETAREAAPVSEPEVVEAAPLLLDADEDGEAESEVDAETEAESDEAAAEAQAGRDGEDGGRRRRRRRGRRGGRGRRQGEGAAVGAEGPEGMRVIDPEAAAAAPEPERAEPVRETAAIVETPPRREEAPEPAPAPAEAPAFAAAQTAPALLEAPPAPEALPDSRAEAAPEPEPVPAREPEMAEAGGPAAESASAPAAPAQAAQPDPEAEERRKRWQQRMKSWIGR